MPTTLASVVIAQQHTRALGEWMTDDTNVVINGVGDFTSGKSRR